MPPPHIEMKTALPSILGRKTNKQKKKTNKNESKQQQHEETAQHQKEKNAKK